MTQLFRLIGVSQVVLGLAHVVLWRLFGWSQETERLSPLTSRVFLAHTFFVALVLVMLGGLEVLRPELLVDRSELARIFLGGATVFWVLRLLAQPLVFDPVLPAYALRTPLRITATLLFATYTAAHAWGFVQQLPR